MATNFKLNRREFFKIGLGAGSGLIIGFTISGCDRVGRSKETPGQFFKPNAWVSINPSNVVTITVAESEMGQGVLTSLPMLVAEELEAEWSNVRFEQAPVDPVFGYQSTGGSSSVRSSWNKLRRAGAIARDMLILAGATKWGVPKEQCKAQNGLIVHLPSGRQYSFGQLADTAAALPIPDEAFLKSPKDFRIIGKEIPRLDIPVKTNGAGIFGSDITLPGILTAIVTHCPTLGGKVVNFNADRARKIRGVTHVLKIGDNVAVVAENFWAAKKAQELLKITWDHGDAGSISNNTIHSDQVEAIEEPGTVIENRGSIEQALKTVAKTIQGYYQAPFQAHATMEPMCCTAYVRNGECDVWAPTQSPSKAESVAMNYTLSKTHQLIEELKKKITGQKVENIRIHTTFLGGGFGRRLRQDYVEEAIQISAAIQKPIKLVWSREEDIRHDFYRPATYHKLVAGLSESNMPVVWNHRIVGPAKGISYGGADSFPYMVQNFRLEFIRHDYPVPIGPWRSVGSSHNAFVMESFVDELANLAKQDPYAFRRQLLQNSPRDLAVLDLAARKANWGAQLEHGRAQGIALHKSFGTYVAQVAEVSVAKNGEIKVHRVVCACDCGSVVNPNIIRAQMEGGIVFGLTATLKSEITITKGIVDQSNFHDFPLLHMHEMPEIETHIVRNNELPTGVGEPGVPPISAAIANAVFAATGIRVRKLPILPQDLQ